jgi:hypothetical protein
VVGRRPGIPTLAIEMNDADDEVSVRLREKMTLSRDRRLRELLIEVLRTIRNTGDSRLRHQFFWRSPKYRDLPPSVLTGSAGLEWYLYGDGTAIASLVTTCARGIRNCESESHSTMPRRRFSTYSRSMRETASGSRFSRRPTALRTYLKRWNQTASMFCARPLLTGPVLPHRSFALSG